MINVKTTAKQYNIRFNHRGKPFQIVLLSLFVASIVGLIDIAAFKFASHISFKVIFFERFGILNSAISVYTMILLILLGAGVGLFAVIIQGIIKKYLFQDRPNLFILFSLSSISIFLIWLRVRTRHVVPGEPGFFAHYLIYFCILLVLLLLFFYRKNFLKGLNKRQNTRFIISFTLGIYLIIYFLPFLNEGYHKLRFQSRKQTSNVPNIILIIMDTVRADALCCYGSSRKTSPHIDEVAKEGAIFLRALSPAPWTPPSHASIFTGLYPSQVEVGFENEYLSDRFITLAEYLNRLGFQTVGFVENPFVGRSRGFAQGFRNFYEMYIYGHRAILPRIIDKIRAEFFNYKNTHEYTDETIKFFKRWVYKNHLSKNSAPFFAFFNLMPAHLPNYIRKKFAFCHASSQDLSRIEPVNKTPEKFYLPRYELDEHDLDLMRALYDGEIAYMDSKLGDLFDFLKKHRILEKSILIITSDHGENFGEHGLIEHQFCLYNSLLHVPLIIRFPDKIEPGTIINDPVSTIFLFRTILDLISAPINDELRNIENRSLFIGDQGRELYAEYDNPIEMIKGVIGDEAPADFNFKRFDRNLMCIFKGDRKFIWSSDGNFELFDLEEDWREMNNILSEDKESAKMLQARIEMWQKGLWKPPLEKSIRKIDKIAQEILRSLGYLK